MAERLRVESEHELGSLQESHRAVEEQLARVLSRQQEMERELESLRAEYKDVCCKLSQLTAKQEQAELDVLRNTSRLKDVQETEEGERKTKQEDEDEEAASQDGADKGGDHDPERVNGSGNAELTGKGVAEGYIRSLAALEKKKGERGQRDARKIVMLCERSW